MRSETKWGFIVVLDDSITDDEVQALGVTLSAMEGVERVVGPQPGEVTICEECEAGRPHAPHGHSLQ